MVRKKRKRISSPVFWGLLPILLLSSCTKISLQDCTGGTGMELFTEDFGSGENPGPALPPGTTTFTYGSIGGGNYVVTNTTGLNGNLWHQAPDHTPNDTNGYCLLVDASSDADILYTRLVEDLRPNTHYTLSFYAANVVSPAACGGVSIEPELSINLVDSNWNRELVAETTGKIPTTPSLSWNKYAISFSTHASPGDISIEITNLSPGGCGNDVAIDDIRLATCQ